MIVNFGKLVSHTSRLNSALVCRALASTQASDPIQKLFVDKIQEYKSKSKSTADGLVEATPKVSKGLKEEMERVARTYGIKDEKNVANLSFKFDAEVKVDSINLRETTK